MLRYGILFLAIALVAALFSFGIVADYSWIEARVLFWTFLALSLLSVLGLAFRDKPARIAFARSSDPLKRPKVAPR